MCDFIPTISGVARIFPVGGGGGGGARGLCFFMGACFPLSIWFTLSMIFFWGGGHQECPSAPPAMPLPTIWGLFLAGEEGCKSGNNHTGAPGDFAPEMQKRALENQKRAPENCHRLQCKSLFNVTDLQSMGCEK